MVLHATHRKPLSHYNGRETFPSSPFQFFRPIFPVEKREKGTEEASKQLAHQIGESDKRPRLTLPPRGDKFLGSTDDFRIVEWAYRL